MPGDADAHAPCAAQAQQQNDDDDAAASEGGRCGSAPRCCLAPVVTTTTAAAAAAPLVTGVATTTTAMPATTTATTAAARPLPSQFLLRHRLGYSAVRLRPRQQRRYTRTELENFLFYKEQKYNAVNTLDRLCALVVVVFSFALFALVFSVSTSDWLVLFYADVYRTIGLFVTCTGRSTANLQQRCHRTGRGDDDGDGSVAVDVRDAVTGQRVCRDTASFVRRYVAAMWTVELLQLLAALAALLLVTYVALRPTRTGALRWLVLMLLVCTCAGVVNSVLFARYTRCRHRTCDALHASWPACLAAYRWAYRVYIAAAALFALCFVFALGMYSFTHILRERAAQILQAARQRRQQQQQQQPQPCAATATQVAVAAPLLHEPVHEPVHDAMLHNNNDNNDNNSDDDDAATHSVYDTAHTSLMTTLRDSVVCSALQQQQQPPTTMAPAAAMTTRGGGADDSAFTRVRRRRSVLMRVLNRDYDRDYLTARELGVRIAGADDWVYDDRSDMFYSFVRDAFYDPLTREYYNCALRTWQQHMSDVVDVRAIR